MNPEVREVFREAREDDSVDAAALSTPAASSKWKRR